MASTLIIEGINNLQISVTDKGAPTSPITFQEFMEIEKVNFLFSECLDWDQYDRLRTISAPFIHIDYSQVGKEKNEAMPLEDYIKWIGGPEFLGDPAAKSQHLVGVGYYERTAPDKVTGYHQIHATHHITDKDSLAVKATSHAHCTNEHYYEKIGGKWKFAGHKVCINFLSAGFEQTRGGNHLPSDPKDQQKLQAERPAHELKLT